MEFGFAGLALRSGDSAAFAPLEARAGIAAWKSTAKVDEKGSVRECVANVILFGVSR